MGWVGLDLYVCGLGWVVGYENGPMDNSELTSDLYIVHEGWTVTFGITKSQNGAGGGHPAVPL